MAKMTLLEMVQSTMSALDSDEVENIDDTPESEQIVDLIVDLYRELTENENIPELHKLFLLTLDTGNTVFTIPTDISKLFWIKYDKRKTAGANTDYLPVYFLDPSDFIERTNGRNSTDSTVESLAEPGGSGISILIKNNKAPEWWTTFDDEHIVMDSYDSGIDASGLVASKTQCFGQEVPTVTRVNSTVLDLDGNLFPFLLAEVKSTAFSTLKQEINQKIDKQARQAKAKYQNDRHRF